LIAKSARTGAFCWNINRDGGDGGDDDGSDDGGDDPLSRGRHGDDDGGGGGRLEPRSAPAELRHLSASLQDAHHRLSITARRLGSD
jgi:hypothetical protein